MGRADLLVGGPASGLHSEVQVVTIGSRHGVLAFPPLGVSRQRSLLELDHRFSVEFQIGRSVDDASSNCTEVLSHRVTSKRPQRADVPLVGFARYRGSLRGLLVDRSHLTGIALGDGLRLVKGGFDLTIELVPALHVEGTVHLGLISRTFDGWFRDNFRLSLDVMRRNGRALRLADDGAIYSDSIPVHIGIDNSCLSCLL